MRIIPAHRKYRRKRPVRAHGTAIYCREKDILSRPIIGHTPRKLPASAAISRIIAVHAGAMPWQFLHKLTYCTVCGEKCQEKFSLFFIKFFWDFWAVLHAEARVMTPRPPQLVLSRGISSKIRSPLDNLNFIHSP